MPCRFLAGGLPPDHDIIANFRKTFLQELKALFVHILLYAQAIGVLTLGNISLDGTQIHADASKSSAIRYQRLLELASQLRTEVDQLFALTDSRPRLAAQSTACENVQSNRCWALSKTSWVFANSRCVACGLPLVNGVWCVWHST
jgi:hypothetical protein